MKYSQSFGVFAAVVLVASCTLNWTWYHDLQEHFTGFYSAGNNYGKPGRVFLFMAAVATIFFLLKRVWAKRWNLLVCGLIVAYAVKTFILYTSCYRGICPEKQAGIWIMLAAAIMMMVAAVLPDLKLREEVPNDQIH